MSQRVLVSGVNGQVGSAIMLLQQRCPFELIPISRAEWDMAEKPAKIVDLIKKYEPAAFINPAAFTNVDGAERDYKTAYAVNVKAVGELAKACKKASIPLLHVSTDYVFDGTKNSPYVEEDFVNPINVYGKSKAEGEKLIMEILDKFIILRTSWVFSNKGKNFVTTMRKLSQEHNELKVIDDQRGRPTSATSIANVLLEFTTKILKDKFISWGIYHYAGYPSVSWFEFAKAIFEVEKENPKPKLIPCASSEFLTKAIRPKNSILSTERIKNLMRVVDCDWRSKLNKDI